MLCMMVFDVTVCADPRWLPGGGHDNGMWSASVARTAPSLSSPVSLPGDRWKCLPLTSGRRVKGEGCLVVSTRGGYVFGFCMPGWLSELPATAQTCVAGCEVARLDLTHTAWPSGGIPSPAPTVFCQGSGDDQAGSTGKIEVSLSTGLLTSDPESVTTSQLFVLAVLHRRLSPPRPAPGPRIMRTVSSGCRSACPQRASVVQRGAGRYEADRSTPIVYPYNRANHGNFNVGFSGQRLKLLTWTSVKPIVGA